jgi:hypothetical protein
MPDIEWKWEDYEEYNNFDAVGNERGFKSDMTQKRRDISVDWMYDCCKKFQMRIETFLCAINILDQLSFSNKESDKTMALYMTACLWIASKYEEVFSPDASEYIWMADNMFKVSELITVEREILKIIEYRVTYPTVMSFIQPVDGKLSTLQQLVYLSMSCKKLRKYFPSVVGDTIMDIAHDNSSRSNNDCYEDFRIAAFHLKLSHFQ